MNHPMGMTTDEVKKAIQAALSAKGQDKMDFIAFDTCLMGGAEILGDFSTFCDVFFACPELDYGDGWDYDKTLNYLKANPDVDIKNSPEKGRILEHPSWRSNGYDTQGSCCLRHEQVRIFFTALRGVFSSTQTLRPNRRRRGA